MKKVVLVGRWSFCCLVLCISLLLIFITMYFPLLRSWPEAETTDPTLFPPINLSWSAESPELERRSLPRLYWITLPCWVRRWVADGHTCVCSSSVDFEHCALLTWHSKRNYLQLLDYLGRIRPPSIHLLSRHQSKTSPNLPPGWTRRSLHRTTSTSIQPHFPDFPVF